jgi:indolepyruvate ferredoxin oxidoreductase, alpha subunit
MVYNRPPTGHVVLILDNGTTAMTGQQEHPATGRALGHEPAPRLSLEAVCPALGVDRVAVFDPVTERASFEKTLLEMLERRELGVLIARRACLLLPRKLRDHAGPRDPE